MAIADELLTDLQAELSITDVDYNETLLTSKINGAIREVKLARKYPATYTDTMIETDLGNYYSTMRNIALYDYKKIGADFQTSDSENTYSRNYVDRNSLFNDVLPLSRL